MSSFDCCKPDWLNSILISEIDKADHQLGLAFSQRLAGDTAGAKVTAEQARNTLEQLYRDQPDDPNLCGILSQAYAVMGEKDSALKLAERAVMLEPRAKDPVTGPTFEENLAVVQTLVGDNNGAISTLTRLLQTPYEGNIVRPNGRYPGPSEARSDLGSFARRSRFPKTLRGKAAVKTRITRIVTRHELHELSRTRLINWCELVNGAEGVSDIEGKATTGSGERAGMRASFKFVSHLLNS